jgi:hypothetical protein
VIPLGGTRIYLGLVRPLQGLTFGVTREIFASPGPTALFLAGGILANAVLALVAAGLLAWSKWGASVWLVVLWLNGSLALGSLLPLEFKVGNDGNNLVFSIQMGGPVENPWGAPNGLAIQLVDIYIDTDGAASGTRLLRNGRNAALASGSAWDVALSLAGWNYGFFKSAAPETADKSVPVNIITDPGRNLIIAKIPLSAIPGDPSQWKFAVAVMSNDGYGINGVRDVTTEGGQWVLGGASADKNHTRIIDILWPAGMTPTQEEMLSAYTPSQADPASLGPDDFPQVQMFLP